MESLGGDRAGGLGGRVPLWGAAGRAMSVCVMWCWTLPQGSLGLGASLFPAALPEPGGLCCS